MESLTPTEHAWVRVQTSENLSVSTVVIVCEGPVDHSGLKSRIEDRLLAYGRLRQRIEYPQLPLARPRWQDHDDFQLSDHLVVVDLANADQPTTLQALVGQLRSQPLDDTLPLWQIHLTRLERNRSALVFRTHAAVADGTAISALALQLIDGESGTRLPYTEIGFEHLVSSGPLLERLGKGAAATRMLCQLIILRADHDNPWRSRLTGAKINNWSEAVDLTTFLDRAGYQGYSATEVLVTAVVRALRRALHRQDIPAEDVNLRAVVPVGLRQQGDSLTGSRLALGLMGLPLRSRDIVSHIDAVHQEIEQFCLAPREMAVLGSDPTQSLSMTEIEERSIRLLSQKATVLLSILDGPADPQQLCGQPISNLMWWPAQSGEIALGISAVGYAGRVRFGVSCDSALAADATALATEIVNAATAV